jgi:hypothetical protein
MDLLHAGIYAGRVIKQETAGGLRKRGLGTRFFTETKDCKQVFGYL